MIRVLVVDDSPTTREVLTWILQEDPEIEVVGQAADGRQAVEMTLQLKPDLITMDIVMPEMDGIEATRSIMDQCPTPILVVSASDNIRELNLSFEAIRAGALDLVEKPHAINEGEKSERVEELLRKVKTIAGITPSSPEGEE